MMLIEGSSVASFPGLLTDWMEPSDGRPNLVTTAGVPWMLAPPEYATSAAGRLRIQLRQMLRR